MRDRNWYNANRSRLTKGLPETGLAIHLIDELKVSEWSPEFERLMRNRLLMGSIRYGKLRAKGKPAYDRTGSIIKRLERYKETGNKEFLVDCANLCLVEFVECKHPKAHFSAVDGGEHVEISDHKKITDPKHHLCDIPTNGNGEHCFFNPIHCKICKHNKYLKS